VQRSAEPLRFIAVRLNVPELKIAARQPGVAEALRITVQYHDGRHPDQVATLTKMQGSDAAKLAVHYRRPNDKPLVLDYPINAERFTKLNLALRALGFDKQDDQPDIPWYGADLWLVERAAGTFHHDVILAPDRAIGIHGEFVRLVRDHLLEAVRTIHVS